MLKSSRHHIKSAAPATHPPTIYRIRRTAATYFNGRLQSMMMVVSWISNRTIEKSGFNCSSSFRFFTVWKCLQKILYLCSRLNVNYGMSASRLRFRYFTQNICARRRREKCGQDGWIQEVSIFVINTKAFLEISSKITSPWSLFKYYFLLNKQSEFGISTDHPHLCYW